MARRCGAKHICKSKCAKHNNLGPILEVPMFKNGTPLWREAHLQVKMRKNTTISDLFWKSRCSKNGTRLWREAHLQVKMHKTPHCRSHFGSSDVQKWHAAVARSTFASQNAQNTTLLEPFWKFRCSKMARGCGAKHICKSQCVKHSILGPLFEVHMSKN